MKRKILVAATVALFLDDAIHHLALNVVCLHMEKNKLDIPQKEEVQAHLNELGRLKIIRIKRLFGLNKRCNNRGCDFRNSL